MARCKKRSVLSNKSRGAKMKQKGWNLEGNEGRRIRQYKKYEGEYRI